MNQGFIENLIQYIETTNNTLNKYASLHDEELDIRNKFNEKLAEAVDILADKKVIPADYKEGIFINLKGSPEKVAELLIQAYDQPNRIGSSASGYRDNSDPILDFIFS